MIGNILHAIKYLDTNKKGAVTKSTLRKQHLLEAKRSKKSQKMAQGI